MEAVENRTSVLLQDAHTMWHTDRSIAAGDIPEEPEGMQQVSGKICWDLCKTQA